MSRLVKIIPRTLHEITFEHAVKAFLLECRTKNLSARTVGRYEDHINYFVDFLKQSYPGSQCPLSLVTAQALKTFIQYHRQRENQKKQGHTLSSYTVKGTVVSLKVLLKYLYQEGYLKENVAAKIATPKVQKKIIQGLSPEQIQALLQIPNKKTFTGFRNYAIFLLFLDSGIRLNELLSLKINSIDFSTNSMIVLGKGNKERRVPFGMHVRKTLEKYLAWRGDVPGHDILFVSSFGEKMKGRHVAKIVEDYGKKAAITGVRMSPHTLRHTFAKMSLLNGMDAITLQYILGHTTLDMVRNYVNLTSQDVALNKNRFSLMDRMGIQGATQRKKLW